MEVHVYASLKFKCPSQKYCIQFQAITGCMSCEYCVIANGSTIIFKIDM